ncbi:DNA pilot protein [Apis mellifera associated microvirus 46]|nr:DNA pilot protein [Apis mellifera associated microvirus 46]
MGLFSTIGKVAGGFLGGPTGSAIGGSIGGYLDDRSSNKAKAAASDRAWSNTRQAADLEYNRQKEFAKMGIRWRVADAKAAGLHPLAAIGAVGSSYSPTVTVDSPRSVPEYDNLEAMGQNLMRARMATSTPAEKEAAALALKNASLRNDLLEAQIASQWATIDAQLRAPSMPSAVGPSAPVALGPTAVVDGGRVKYKPSEITSPKRGFNQIEAGKHPSMRDYEMPGGGSIRLPSPQLAETLENMGAGVPQAFMVYNWAREKAFGPGIDKPLPKGYHWKWSVWDQGYRAVRDR